MLELSEILKADHSQWHLNRSDRIVTWLKEGLLWVEEKRATKVWCANWLTQPCARASRAREHPCCHAPLVQKPSFQNYFIFNTGLNYSQRFYQQTLLQRTHRLEWSAPPRPYGSYFVVQSSLAAVSQWRDILIVSSRFGLAARGASMEAHVGKGRNSI